MAATRLFFPETLAGDVTPPAPGGSPTWEHVNSPLPIRKLLAAVDSSTLTTTAYTPDSSDHLVAGDACHRQYVSAPLQAQTFSGNIKAQFQCLEAHANNNLSISLLVKVCSGDGSSTQAFLLALTADGTEVNTSLRNITFASVALTGYTCIDGDRLVVEVGLSGAPTASGGVQGHNGSIRFGCSASGGNLPENDTDTGTTLRPWIEFSGGVLFLYPQTVAPTAVGVAARTSIASFYRALAPTAVGVAALVKASVFAKLLVATGVSIAALTLANVFSKALSAVSVGVSVLSRTLTLRLSISATGVGVAALSRALTLSLSLTATAVGVAVLTQAKIFLRTLAATAIGIVDLVTQFISGGGGGGPIFRIGIVPIRTVGVIVAGVVRICHVPNAPGVVPVHTVPDNVPGVVPTYTEATLSVGIVPVKETT